MLKAYLVTNIDVYFLLNVLDLFLLLGIITEIGFISRFPKEEKLANFTGLCWRKRQLEKFTANNTFPEFAFQKNVFLEVY